MTNRDDFEHRLSQGLKRWAESGRPALDLEAYVKEQMEETAPQPEVAPFSPVTPLSPVAPRKAPALWRRPWFTATAAAAALLLATTFSFPLWAGAAAELPLVGPVLQEFILKDAGLKWAYENNLIQGTLAEASLGTGKVKILGVMADARRTTVIYQITGLPAPTPAPAADAKPLPAGQWAPPRDEGPDVMIRAIDGQGAASWRPAPKYTPVGYVGIASTTPLQADSGELAIEARYGTEKATLKVTASRAETDKFSREVAVNQSQTVDDVTVKVESVIYTPAETLVQYQVSKPEFYGSYSPVTDARLLYLVTEGKEIPPPSEINGINGQFIVAFPAVRGKATLVISAQVKGVPANLEWPLQAGATQEVGGVVVTLQRWSRTGDQIELEWSLPNSASVVGLAGFDMVNAAGDHAALGRRFEGNGFYKSGENMRNLSYNADLPADFQPVAIRARTIGVEVVGPWRFDLPR